MLTSERNAQIMGLVDRYNRGKATPVSPFIAQADGNLEGVAKQIGVPTPELDEFLGVMNRQLPNDYLIGG